MIKLVAVDLDGTLLTDEMKIPAETKNLIKEVVKKQITFVIATGRPYKTAKKVLEELEIDQPMVLHNGSILRDETGKLRICREIPYETCREIMDFCNQKQYVCSVVYGDCDRAIVNMKDDFTVAMHRTNHATEPEISEHLTEGKEAEAVTKIIVTDEREELIDGMLAELQAAFSEKVNVMKSGKYYIDLVPLGASKGFGVKILAERLGIPNRQIMAVGDSGNDLSMLSFAGCAVAMANAETQVKECADHTTLSNNEQGVAAAIRKFIMNA